MNDNLFDPKIAADQQQQQIEDYVAELVGPGKKFEKADLQEFSKSLYHANKHISHLEEEMAEARNLISEYQKNTTSESKYKELVDLIKGQQTNGNSPQAEVDEKPELKIEDIEQRILSRLDQKSREERERANFNSVVSKLREELGTSFQQILNEQKQATGLSDEEINRLARTSPTAFFRVMGLDQKRQPEGFQAPPRSSQRNDTFAPNVYKEHKPWSYYQRLWKEKPSTRFDPKIRSQMYKDRDALGDAFKDGDYRRDFP